MELKTKPISASLKEDDFFERPPCLLPLQNGPSKNLATELLLFFVLFIITSVLQTALSLLIMLVKGAMDSGATDIQGQLQYALNAVILNAEGLSPTDENLLYSTGISTLFILLYVRFVQKRRLSTLGLFRQGALRQYAGGLLFGGLMLCAAALLCRLLGMVHFSLKPGPLPTKALLILFGGYLVQGMSEEVLCRGYLMTSLARRYALPLAIFISSLCFSLMHLGNESMSALSILNLLLFGLLASLYFIRSGSLWGACALHSIWNFLQGNVLGIPVSGIPATTSIYTAELKAGADLIHGGSFGLEGGLATTAVLLLFTLQISLYTKKATNKQ